MARQPAWRKARRVPSFPRHILFGSAPTIAGRSGQCPCDTHHRPQCPRLRHGPHSRQRLCLSHDPKSLTAASTQESSTQERNVDIRHASRERRSVHYSLSVRLMVAFFSAGRFFSHSLIIERAVIFASSRVPKTVLSFGNPVAGR